MSAKKKIFAVALAVCMVSIISFSTLAWFNASESVTNKFMVASTGSGSGGTNPDAEKVFSIDVWEKVDKNGDGSIVKDEKVSYRNDVTPGWEYEDILPGVEYHKEPVVENTGSYEQWVRVLVTVTDAAAWKSIITPGYDLGEIFKNFDDTKWTRDAVIDDTENDTLTYVYYLNEKLPHAAKDTTVDDDHMVTLFTAVELPGYLTQEHMAILMKNDKIDFDIIVRADAIQTSLADNAKDAFAAIGADGWSATEDYEQAMNP